MKTTTHTTPQEEYDNKVKKLMSQYGGNNGLEELVKEFIDLKMAARFFEQELGSKLQEGELTIEEVEAQEEVIWNEVMEIKQ